MKTSFQQQVICTQVILSSTKMQKSMVITKDSHILNTE